MTSPRTKLSAQKASQAIRELLDTEHPAHADDAVVQYVEKLIESVIDEYTTQKLADAAAETARAMALYDLSCSLVTSGSADELVDVIMTYLEPLGATTCAIMQFVKEANDNTKMMASWPPKNPFVIALETSDAKRSVLAPILCSQSTLVLDNATNEPTLDENTRAMLRAFHIGSLMSVPLLLHAELVGRLVITWPSARHIDQYAARVLHTVATQATAVAERLFLVDRYQHEIQERTALEAVLVQAQQALVRELGTPIIPVADDILLMPLVGTIDAMRAQRITDVILSGIVARGAATAILDMSGVPTVTAQIADALLGVTRAVRLVGAEVVITGMRPDMARTLVEGGATLEGFIVRSTVQSGIAFALAKSSAQRRSPSRRT